MQLFGLQPGRQLCEPLNQLMWQAATLPHRRVRFRVCFFFDTRRTIEMGTKSTGKTSLPRHGRRRIQFGPLHSKFAVGRAGSNGLRILAAQSGLPVGQPAIIED
jgi:hypothetical protein